MAGLTGARLLVGRVRGVATLIAGRWRPDPALLPERLFLPPEAAKRELGDLEAVGIRAGDRRAEDRVGLRAQDGLAAARQGLGGCRHLGLREQEHQARDSSSVVRLTSRILRPTRDATMSGRATTAGTSERADHQGTTDDDERGGEDQRRVD